ncbi:YheC/YheD family protein [Paenibacillus dakarensis]|uniref:YheC/YheD family protein n=1 Tax=Paenibacillus dakarensis TaxID=1527293 RepID=UPI0006D5A67B|nr:YheC/YheD family protein [Paenibacillus dakarensis]
MAGRQLANKWLKTEALLTDPQIIPYIPETKAYNRDDLMSMLSQYNMVVIKPVVGTGGNGVIRIEEHNEGYQVRYKGSKKYVASFPSLVHLLSRLKMKRRYLIQQGIELARIGDRPLDYRFKVVKIRGRWIFKATVARLARRGLFVTNLCKGGTLLHCRPAIRRSLPHINSAEKRNEMRQLTRTCIAVLETSFPGIRELGFDYGLDQTGAIWILEVNTRPS